MSEIDEITNKLIEFRDKRDSQQFHNAKDLAVAIAIEANELLELFLWKKPEDVNTEKLKEELADVFSFCFFLAVKFNFNIKEIIPDKLKTSDEKYPVDKSKGTAKKYNEL